MSSSTIAPARPAETTLTSTTVIVAGRRDVADGIIELTLAAPDGQALPTWEPGAHIALNLENGLVRQYSLCGDPDDATWRISVLREPDSRGGSSFIHDHVHEGTSLDVTGPTNQFPLHDADEYVFVAGGIGITPILSMIEAAEAKGAQWSLHYAGRSRRTMAYLEDLEQRFGDRVLARPRETSERLPVDEVVSAAGAAQMYCCGPESLMDAFHESAQGVPGATLHTERFSPLDIDTSGDQAFEIELAGEGVTLQVQPDESVLDVVERQGLVVLSSCREGTCGSCEVEVIEGEVDHRDTVLTDEERASNEVMMICVSRSKCPRLVLDL